MLISNKHLSRRTILRGIGVAVALPLLDAMVPARTLLAQGAAATNKKLRFVALEMVHGSAGSTQIGIQRNLWAPAAVGSAFDLGPERAGVTRTLPRRPHHRQQHRREERRGVHRAGNRRRSLPLERGVPDPVAPQADAGIGPARRRLARSDLRQQIRAGDADSVDAAVHRERRSGRRLLLRLFLRLHRLDQLVVAVAAAADDSRSASGVRSAVRRRRDAGRAQGAARRGSQHPRLARHVDRPRRRRTSAPPIRRA